MCPYGRSTILWTHPVLSVPDVLTPTLLVFLRLMAFCLVLLVNCILFLPHNFIYCIHFSGADGSNLTPKFGLNAETDNATCSYQGLLGDLQASQAELKCLEKARNGSWCLFLLEVGARWGLLCTSRDLHGLNLLSELKKEALWLS